MKKLLQINSVVNKGSTGRIAEQISDVAMQNGWQSYIAYGRKSNSSNANLIRIGSDFDVKMHSFYSFALGRHGMASVESTKQLINTIKEISPDVVHLHNIHGYYINFPILFQYFEEQQVEVVWTLHDCWSFTGHCSYFSDINCIKWKTECSSCPKIRNYPTSLFFDTSKEFFHLKQKIFNLKKLHIVTVSDWLKGLVKQSFLKNHNIRTIHNGVNLSIFTPQPKDTHLVEKYKLTDKFVMLAVSTSWAKQKGFDDYIELSKYLKENEKIVLVGLPEKLTSDLPDSIIAINRTESQEELSKWYNIADVVLNLSYQETFGLTSVEGFACGKPTLLYNATASPELISQAELGEIIPAGNVAEAYEGIQKIKDNKKFYPEAAIRKVAEQKFDIQKQYKKYIDLYAQLL